MGGGPVLEIRLLGPLEIVLDGRTMKVPGRRLAALVTILALSPGASIPVDVVVDRLWGEQLPCRAKPTLHTYIARLRRSLGHNTVETLPSGYRLRIEPDQVDAIRLANLLREAECQRDDTRKRTMLETAAGLWRDVPFAGVAAPDWLTGEATRLTELHLSAIEQRIDLDLAAGRYGGLLTELQELTARYPLREPLWVRLLKVLRLNGRTAQALESYEQVRTIVADELGVDPAPALQQEFALLVAPRTAQPAACLDVRSRSWSARSETRNEDSMSSPIPTTSKATCGRSCRGRTKHWSRRTRGSSGCSACCRRARSVRQWPRSSLTAASMAPNGGWTSSRPAIW